MHARGVLIQPRGDLVLRFLDRDPVDVVDPFADRIVPEPIAAARESEVIVG